MKIGIISDTHINNDVSRLDKIINLLGDIGIIIHAGDYTSMLTIDELKKFTGFMGVYGNVDNDDIRKSLKEKVIVEIMGYKIGIYHGHGQGKTTMDRAYDMFADDNVDIIVFGHSHQPVIMTKGGILMLNPGSPTNKRRERWFSYILLELNKEGISATLNFF